MHQIQISPENFLILIVDDTESNIKLLSHVLRKENYRVIAAFDGDEAIELAKERNPDLILLDVLMPGKSGIEVCKILKEDKELAKIPVIFLSALSEISDKIVGLKAGGVDYITKPFHREETLARINTHLFLHQLRKEREERIAILKKREAQLRELNYQKDELVRIVSHDIQNPLTGIVGLASLVRNKYGSIDAELEEMLAVIERSGNKLLNLVAQVLDNKENEPLRNQLHLEPCKIADILDQVLDVNLPKAQFKRIAFTIEDKTEISTCKLDRIKIEIALNNLVSNALKFTGTNGRVIVEAYNQDKSLIFKVTDTGIGIPAHMLETLFQTSTPNSSTTGTAGEIGSGLGLDIVQNYIEMHKGTISVSSKENEGSTFTISLPIVQ